MGFSATTVSPQATPSQTPIARVLPFTSFSARRKNTGGFSRRSWALAATANGQSFPVPAQVGLGRIAVEAAEKMLVPPGSTIEMLPGSFHRFGSLAVVAASVGKNLPYFRGVAGGFRSVPIVKSGSKSSAPSSVVFGHPFMSAELTKSSKPNAPVFVGVVPTEGGGFGS